MTQQQCLEGRVKDWLYCDERSIVWWNCLPWDPLLTFPLLHLSPGGVRTACTQESAQQTWDCSPEKGLLARLALDWCLGTWISGVVPLFPNWQVWLFAPAWFVQTMWCMVNSVHLLYFWECRVWYVTMWPMSNDNPGLWVSPVDNISQVLSHLFAGGVNYIPCDFQGWKFAPGFLLHLVPLLILICIFHFTKL